MMRISTIFFCLLLAAAAAGRYRAEANVRLAKQEIETLQLKQADESEKIDKLRLDVKVLESAPRTSDLTNAYTNLTQIKPSQMQNADQFLALVTYPAVEIPAPVEKKTPLDEQYRINAIAMMDFAKGQ